MTAPAIRIEGLWKEYAIGGREPRLSLRETLRDALAAPLRRLRSRHGTEATEKFWALRDINLEIAPGEVVGIIGRNGAGKSTLLKILSRITAPTRGRIEINGRIASLLEVGTGFHAELTGRENVRLNGAILGMSSAEIARKFDEIVAFSGVEKFIDTPVKHYSSGMQVRLAFAVAAHLEPEILIVDEVLAVGDAEFQKKCLGRMQEVAGGGRTVLFVSHNMGAVSDLCSRGVLIEDGAIGRDGPSAEVITKYLSVRSSPNATTTSRQDDRVLALIGAEVVGANGGGNCVFWSSDFNLLFYYRAVEVPGLELAFTIFDQYGRKVFYSNQKEPYLANVSNGMYLAKVRVPGRFLAPGAYTVTAGLYQPNVHIHDRVSDIAAFSIVADSPEHYRFGNTDIGVVTVDLEWTIEQRCIPDEA